MAKIKTRNTDNHHTKPKKIDRRAFERVYLPYIPLVIAVSLLLGLGFNSGNLAAYVRHPGGRVLSYSTSMSISGLLSDTNSARSSNGVASLGLNSKLDAAAQAKADDMVARDYWSHNTPDGDPPWVFVQNQGYSYIKLGENLATGFDNEQAVINGWLASPEHRANMLDPAFKEVGFGFANSANYTAAGGGPMTVVVAFYGEPTGGSVPAASVPSTTSPSGSSLFPSAPSTSLSPTTPTAVPSAAAPAPSQQAVTTDNPPSTKTKPIKQSRAQLALTGTKLPPAVASLSVLAAVMIFGFWASSHLMALRRFLVKGERYVIRHPLADISIIAIAALIFILSQIAGIVQ